MSYDNFCEAVVRAGEITTMTINRSCAGWYTASKGILAQASQEKNCLRHHLHDCNDLSSDEILAIKLQLKLINKWNHDLVELAKARWYKGICEKIHEMNMDPRLAWENICTLTGSETAHHTSNINMAMHLKNREHVSVWRAFPQSPEQPSPRQPHSPGPS